MKNIKYTIDESTYCQARLLLLTVAQHMRYGVYDNNAWGNVKNSKAAERETQRIEMYIKHIY